MLSARLDGRVIRNLSLEQLALWNVEPAQAFA